MTPYLTVIPRFIRGAANKQQDDVLLGSAIEHSFGVGSSVALW
ncbi:MULTISPECIES: hypothetical protein [unclassified Wolbachia]